MGSGRRDSEEVIDLSVPLASLNSPVYPGSPLPVKSTFLTIEETGFQSNLWVFEEHTGTHVDAPAHILAEGDSVEEMSASRYVGPGVVLDFSACRPKSVLKRRDMINAMREIGLEDHRMPGSILLLYTGYTSKFGTSSWLDNPVLGTEACHFIAGLKPKAIGIDAASPDREPFPAHKLLLPMGISIYENLTNLNLLLHRDFLFVGASLPLVGGTASPVRALALVRR